MPGEAADRDSGIGVYQVWHDAGWPERAGLNARFGVETPFPAGFLHVADVQASGLGQAAALTSDAGDILDPDGAVPWQPWESKAGVRPIIPRPFTRDTDAGDVIVDPHGRAHRYDGRGFRAIEGAAKQHGPDAADRGRHAPTPGAIGRRDGRFQVWHANDVEAVTRGEMDGGPFGHGYTLAARVEAREVVHAFYLTNHDDTPWPQKPGAEAMIDEPRSTTAGDVIVDPQGRAYRVEAGAGSGSWGFRLIFPRDGKSPEQRSRENFERFLEAAARGQGGNRVPSPGEIAERDSPAPAPGPERGQRRGRR
jgi:hypothetical protein